MEVVTLLHATSFIHVSCLHVTNLDTIYLCDCYNQNRRNIDSSWRCYLTGRPTPHSHQSINMLKSCLVNTV